MKSKERRREGERGRERQRERSVQKQRKTRGGQAGARDSEKVNGPNCRVWGENVLSCPQVLGPTCRAATETGAGDDKAEVSAGLRQDSQPWGSQRTGRCLTDKRQIHKCPRHSGPHHGLRLAAGGALERRGGGYMWEGVEVDNAAEEM